MPPKEKDYVVKARVQVTVDLDAKMTWPIECTMGQVLEQAKTAALNQLDKLNLPFCLIKEPVVTLIFLQEK